MIKKMITLVGVALLLSSTILSPASAVAQTLTNQFSELTTQSDIQRKLGNSAKAAGIVGATTSFFTKSIGTNNSSNQEKKIEVSATENKTEANSNSSQVKEETASKKADYVKEKNESKPGAPPAAKDTKTISTQLQVTKTLTGRALQEGEFEFELRDGQKNLVQTVKNKADGTIPFSPLTFNKSGLYNYQIIEKTGTLSGVQYDKEPINVTIRVAQDKDTGKLEVNTIYKGLDENGKPIAKRTFNNKYKQQQASTQLQVKKKLLGRDLKDQEFDFDLVDNTDFSPTAGKILQTVKNNRNGEVNFKSLAFTKAGTYEYFIREKKGTAAGITYDRKFIAVTVEVEEKSGKLEVSKVTYLVDGEEVNNPTFNNVYTQVKTFAKLQVKKKLLGRDLKDQEFDFDLVDNTDFSPTAGKILQTVKNNGNGEVNFKALAFTKAGTYEYFIREKKGTAAGITYDRKFIAVTVEVEEKSGKLEVSKVTYLVDGEEVNNPTFVNRYKQELTTASLSVNKELTGRPLKDGEFNFELKGNDDGISQTKSNVNGVVNFDKIQYTKAGVYRYTIVEKDNKLNGITYDKKVIHATVTVENKDAKLVAKVEYKNNDQTFKNKYTTKATKASLSATKRLVGRDLKAGEFFFDLKDANGQVLQTKSNGKDGAVQFDAIQYQAVGTYHYTITEKNNALGGVTYDSKVIKVTVEVTDDGNGQLVSKVTYENNDQTFNNTYLAGKATAMLSAKVLFEGHNLRGGEFEFELKGTEDNVYQVKKNTVDGSVAFEALEYTQAGVYHYTITEKAGKLGGVTYDPKVIKATVEVTDGGNGHLVTKVTYENNDQIFKNTYLAAKASAELSVKKILKGRTLKAGEFEFELKGEDGKVVQIKTNVANGNVNFDAIQYTKAGTYHYTITEKDTKLSGVIYDKKVIKATVTVTDDGKGQLHAKVSYDNDIKTFENRYTSSKNDLPKTGTIVHTLAIFIGLIVLAGAMYLIKKKS